MSRWRALALALACGNGAAHAQVEGAPEQLRDRLYAEQIRAGELQIQVNELRRTLAEVAETAQLSERTSELVEENRRLRTRLQDMDAAGGRRAPSGDGGQPGYPFLIAGLAIGWCLGLYWVNARLRRRFGGMRWL